MLRVPRPLISRLHSLHWYKLPFPSALALIPSFIGDHLLPLCHRPIGIECRDRVQYLQQRAQTNHRHRKMGFRIILQQPGSSIFPQHHSSSHINQQSNNLSWSHSIHPQLTRSHFNDAIVEQGSGGWEEHQHLI